MAVNYERLLKDLERELLYESAPDRDFEEELGSRIRPHASIGPLRSLRFADEPELQAVALGHLRLGRANDSPYPVPIRNQGRAVRKVQQALIDLGYPLPRYGDDSNYGQETYQAVLAYKRHFNIRTQIGYLDGIVGPKTIKRLDSNFPPGPLPACPAPFSPVVTAESEVESPASEFGAPWVTCDPLLELSPGEICDKLLPDQGVISSENGDGTAAPSPATFFCINKPHIHLEFTAWWEEMLPPEQRPPDQRNRASNAPRYDVHFKGYSEESFIPGKSYVRDISVAAPAMGNVRFITAHQKNRIFRIRYAIRESN
jgi:hypothetical protein